MIHFSGSSNDNNGHKIDINGGPMLPLDRVLHTRSKFLMVRSCDMLWAVVGKHGYFILLPLRSKKAVSLFIAAGG